MNQHTETKNYFKKSVWRAIKLGHNKLGYFMARAASKIKEKEKRVKKSPNDYPKFAFRIDHESKQKLSEWVDGIYYAYQDRKDEKSLVKRRNDIILDALKIGLKAIEDKIMKNPVRKKDLTLAEWQKRNKKSKPKGALF